METTQQATPHPHNVANQFEQQWPDLRQQVKGWWDRLTDADLEQVAGNKDRLIRAIQGRYGYVYERAEQEVERRLNEVSGSGGKSRIGQLAESAATTAQHLTSEVAKAASDAGGAAQKMATTAATSVSDTVARAGAFLPEVPSGLAGLIRRHPIPSLLIGLGLGVLLGRGLMGTRGTAAKEGGDRQSEPGYPNALIQCTRCGEMIRQADIVEHSTSCRGSGQPSHGGSTS
jgi:uncharacterized protein YjbJ (UPF0337 family)